jgi:hypothetical protein
MPEEKEQTQQGGKMMEKELKCPISIKCRYAKVICISKEMNDICLGKDLECQKKKNT